MCCCGGRESGAQTTCPDYRMPWHSATSPPAPSAPLVEFTKKGHSANMVLRLPREVDQILPTVRARIRNLKAGCREAGQEYIGSACRFTHRS